MVMGRSRGWVGRATEKRPGAKWAVEIALTCLRSAAPTAASRLIALPGVVCCGVVMSGIESRNHKVKMQFGRKPVLLTSNLSIAG